MKKLLLIVATILLSYNIKAQKDDYIPMLGDSIVWHLSGEPWGETYSIKPEMDTIINELVYTKVSEELWNGILTSYLREDSIERKVYILSKDSIEERLLYDFSLKQGDSTFLQFAHIEYTLQTGWYTVDTIMDYFYNNTNRKLYYLTCPENQFIPELQEYPRLYWIEGVGSIIHPAYLDCPNWYVCMYPICPQHVYNMALICTHKEGENIYMHPCWEMAGGDCDSGISIQEKEKIAGKGIYPNPVTDVSKLDLSQINEKIAKIQIFNSLGYLVKEQQAVGSNSKLSVRKSDYTPGLYFLRILTINNRIHSFKFIIN